MQAQIYRIGLVSWLCERLGRPRRNWLAYRRCAQEQRHGNARRPPSYQRSSWRKSTTTPSEFSGSDRSALLLIKACVRSSCSRVRKLDRLVWQRPVKDLSHTLAPKLRPLWCRCAVELHLARRHKTRGTLFIVELFDAGAYG